MKNIVIALSVVLMTVGFVGCDEDFAEGFRYGWNSTTPSEWHYAPAANIVTEAEEGSDTTDDSIFIIENKSNSPIKNR